MSQTTVRGRFSFLPWMIMIIALTVGVGTVAVGAASTVAADEPGPDLPASYYGEIEIDGEPAPAGSILVAEIDGEIRGEIEVQEDGEFGGASAADEKLTVDGESEDIGEPVTFRIADQQLNATPQVAWEPGDVKEVNLTAEEETQDPPSDDPAPPTGGPTPPSDDPANVSITEATLDGEEFETGESVTVTATFENTGDTEGEYNAELIVDGEVMAERPVNVDSDTTETTTFTESFDEPGEYELVINNVSVGTVSIVAEDDESENQNDEATEPSGLEELYSGGIELGLLIGLVSLLITIMLWRRR